MAFILTLPPLLKSSISPDEFEIVVFEFTRFAMISEQFNILMLHAIASFIKIFPAISDSSNRPFSFLMLIGVLIFDRCIRPF